MSLTILNAKVLDVQNKETSLANKTYLNDLIQICVMPFVPVGIKEANLTNLTKLFGILSKRLILQYLTILTYSLFFVKNLLLILCLNLSRKFLQRRSQFYYIRIVYSLEGGHRKFLRA